MRNQASMWAFAAVCGCGSVGPTPQQASEPARAGLSAQVALFQQPLWDDGKAEVALYDVQIARYGQMRDGTAVLIAVKEDFDTEALVKADGPHHRQTAEAMKLNHVLSFKTGVYDYRLMASVWLYRNTGQPLKLVVGSQEWCGLTHKTLAVRGQEATLQTDSYFGAEGRRVFSTFMDGRTTFEDALPLFLRTMDLSRPGSTRMRLLEGQLDNRATPLHAHDAVVRVGAAAVLDVPAGQFNVTPVTVSHAQGEHTLWFEVTSPHVLVRWDRPDSGSYTLRGVRRAAYWDMNAVDAPSLFDAE